MSVTENNEPHQSQAQETCLLTFVPHQQKQVTCTIASGVDAERVAMLTGMQLALAGYRSSTPALLPCSPHPFLGTGKPSPSSSTLVTPCSSSHHPLFPAQAGAEHNCTCCPSCTCRSARMTVNLHPARIRADHLLTWAAPRPFVPPPLFHSSSVWSWMWSEAMQDTSTEELQSAGHPLPRLEGGGDTTTPEVLCVSKPRTGSNLAYCFMGNFAARDLHHLQDYMKAEKESERLPNSYI